LIYSKRVNGWWDVSNNRNMNSPLSLILKRYNSDVF
jgi:hypothetical protein